MRGPASQRLILSWTDSERVPIEDGAATKPGSKTTGAMARALCLMVVKHSNTESCAIDPNKRALQITYATMATPPPAAIAATALADPDPRGLSPT